MVTETKKTVARQKRTFRLFHRPSKQKWVGEADSYKEALTETGWELADCEVKVRSRRGGWKNVDVPQLGGIVPPPEAKSKETTVLQITGKEALSSAANMPEPQKTAWENKIHIMQLSQQSQRAFLKMGELMYEAQEKAHWSLLSYETFQDYIEDLELPMSNSYSWSTRLINIYKFFVKDLELNEDMLIKIGVAKLTRLLPVARDQAITDEILEKAMTLSDRDLQIELGKGSGGGKSAEECINCPRCGVTIYNAKKVGDLRV